MSDERFDLDAALARVASRGGPILILPHDNPDPDSMAAAEALRALFEHELRVEVTVGRGGIIGRAENRALVSVLGLVHQDVQSLDFDAFPVVALVDTQPGTGNNSLPAGRAVDVVVDHHPARPAARAAPWCDVREDFGASCTIAYGYLRARGVPITTQVATALLYAIKSETKDLGRESSPNEVRAYSELLPIADLEQIYAISEPKVPAAHFAALDRGLRAAEVRGPLITANLGALRYPDLVAEIADLLLPYEGAHWVLCLGEYDQHVYMSMRTDRERPHAGELMRKIVDGTGSAGGHGQVAGGRLHAAVTSEDDLNRVYREIVSRLGAALNISNAPERLV